MILLPMEFMQFSAEILMFCKNINIKNTFTNHSAIGSGMVD
jgi:hypothetical protein